MSGQSRCMCGDCQTLTTLLYLHIVCAPCKMTLRSENMIASWLLSWKNLTEKGSKFGHTSCYFCLFTLYILAEDIEYE